MKDIAYYPPRKEEANVRPHCCARDHKPAEKIQPVPKVIPYRQNGSQSVGQRKNKEPIVAQRPYDVALDKSVYRALYATRRALQPRKHFKDAFGRRNKRYRINIIEYNS